MDLWAPDHRVVQGCDADHAGRGLLEKLELLAAHRGQVEEEAGNVAAGAGETRDEAARYRIGLEVDATMGKVRVRVRAAVRPWALPTTITSTSVLSMESTAEL